MSATDENWSKLSIRQQRENDLVQLRWGKFVRSVRTLATSKRDSEFRNSRTVAKWRSLLPPEYQHDVTRDDAHCYALLNENDPVTTLHLTTCLGAPTLEADSLQLFELATRIAEAELEGESSMETIATDVSELRKNIAKHYVNYSWACKHVGEDVPAALTDASRTGFTVDVTSCIKSGTTATVTFLDETIERYRQSSADHSRTSLTVAGAPIESTLDYGPGVRPPDPDSRMYPKDYDVAKMRWLDDNIMNL